MKLAIVCIAFNIQWYCRHLHVILCVTSMLRAPDTRTHTHTNEWERDDFNLICYHHFSIHLQFHFHFLFTKWIWWFPWVKWKFVLIWRKNRQQPSAICFACDHSHLFAFLWQRKMNMKHQQRRNEQQISITIQSILYVRMFSLNWYKWFIVKNMVSRDIYLFIYCICVCVCNVYTQHSTCCEFCEMRMLFIVAVSAVGTVKIRWNYYQTARSRGHRLVTIDKKLCNIYIYSL